MDSGVAVLSPVDFFGRWNASGRGPPVECFGRYPKSLGVRAPGLAAARLCCCRMMEFGHVGFCISTIRDTERPREKRRENARDILFSRVFSRGSRRCRLLGQCLPAQSRIPQVARDILNRAHLHWRRLFFEFVAIPLLLPPILKIRRSLSMPAPPWSNLFGDNFSAHLSEHNMTRRRMTRSAGPEGVNLWLLNVLIKSLWCLLLRCLLSCFPRWLDYLRL
jgi:hypothetical protein